jgi:hypothetical protein
MHVLSSCLHWLYVPQALSCVPVLGLSLICLSFVSPGIERGSGKPNKEMVGQVTKAQVEVRREKEGGCGVH